MNVTRPASIVVTTCMMALIAASSWLAVYWRKEIFIRSQNGDAGFAFLIIMLVFYCGFAFKTLVAYWNGQNWGRQAVLVVSIVTLWEFPPDKLQHKLLLGIVGWTEVVLAVFLLFYLNSTEARTFFGALYQPRPAGPEPNKENA